MANGIVICGDSGSGKSTSIAPDEELGIIGLDPKETFIINIKGKPLPFKGWKKHYIPITKDNLDKGNYLVSTDVDTIVKTLKYVSSKRPEIKNIVIDDSQYKMADEFMSKASETGLTGPV